MRIKKDKFLKDNSRLYEEDIRVCYFGVFFLIDIFKDFFLFMYVLK